MAEMTDIRQVLDQMVKSAEEDDLPRVLSLSDNYCHLVSATFHEPMTGEEIAYDMCAQSCLMAVKRFVPYVKAVADARARLDSINGSEDL